VKNRFQNSPFKCNLQRYSVDKERNTFRVGAFNWISGEAPAATAGGWVMGYGGAVQVRESS
jgi:hypothetical protein